MNHEYLIKIKNIKLRTIRLLFKNLANYGLNKCFFNCKPRIDEDNPGSITILELNQTKNILVKVRLYNFEYFQCLNDVSFTIDVSKFNDCLKQQKHVNKLKLYILGETPNELHINNTKIPCEITSAQPIQIPLCTFKQKTTIASNKLREIYKRFSNSSLIQISTRDDKISFSIQDQGVTPIVLEGLVCEGLVCENKDTIRPNIEACYDLRDLQCFKWCKELSGNLSLYMTDDYPLVCEMFVTNMGKMYIFICPTTMNNFTTYPIFGDSVHTAHAHVEFVLPVLNNQKESIEIEI